MTGPLHPPPPPLPVSVVRSRLLRPRSLGHDERLDDGRTAADLRSADAAISLETPGPCPPGGATVFIVLDESGSVTAGGGNDPLSRRHAETLLAIRHVAGACRCRRDRVALVAFDAGFMGCVAPQPLTAAGLRRLHRGLRRLSRQRGMSSDLDPALRHVERAAQNQRGPVAVVVFSDFLLTDTDPTAVLARLPVFPGYVHAVVLGAVPPSVLTADARVAVTRLTPSSPPGAAARAVFDGLNHYRSH
jgi:hypothetical protein